MVRLVLILAVLFPVLAHADWAPADMNKAIDQTNFLVNDNCSGTLIDKDAGYVLTASHCILGQYRTVTHEAIDEKGRIKKEEIRVAVPGTVSQIFYKGPAEAQRNSYVYKIVSSDTALDLALLQIQTKIGNSQDAKLSCTEPVRGEQVYAVGNSFGVLYSTVTKGIVSSLDRSYRDLRISGQLGDSTDDGEHGLVQHSAPIAGGNSGGALYNGNGEFIGVNVRGIPGGFSFAVPLSDIKTFLARSNLQSLWSGCKQ